MKLTAVLSLALSLLVLALSAPELEASASAPGASDRLILLGFDGGDGRTVEEMMDAGELPNMQRLRERGTFARLGTSVPNESPTSWASLNTGQNPGKNAVSGFMKRIYIGDNPAAYFGFIDPSDTRSIEDFENRPLPTWNAMALGGAAGGAAFAIFMIVFAGLLRLKMLVALPLSAILGCVGAYAGHEARGMMPSEISRTSNVILTRNFWDYAGDAGVESIVLEAAQAFDMPTPEGTRVLAGLGVPDARGDIGTWFIYTDDPGLTERPPKGKRSSTAGRMFRVDFRDGRIETEIFGPKNFCATDKLKVQLDEIEEERADAKLTYADSLELNSREGDLKEQLKAIKNDRVTVPLIIEPRGDKSAAVTMDGHEQVLAVGEWSDFYHLNFILNPLIQVKAVTRCKLVSLGDTFELFINTLDIDPAHPPFWQPISQPHDFAPELVETSHGTFETYGWACTTMPFKDGEISSQTLLEDIEFTMKWRERLTYAQLERDDWRLLMSVFSTTDRVQHMMYQYYDELHPMYEEEEANRKVKFFDQEIALKDVIPEIYRQADRIVGNVMDKYLGENDTLMICADHGFQTFRRQVSINNWLVDAGYMVLKDNIKKSDTKSYRAVDWSKTKAYAMGLGFIYINERGREPKGIVDPSEKMALLKQIQADLLEARDEEFEVNTVLESYLLAEEHSGDHMDIGADLVLGFAPGYRVAWTTTGGGLKLALDDFDNVVNGPIYSDNASPWSGGHPSVARDEVRGIFFCNRKMNLPAGGPNLLHIAPTALDILGVPVPAVMDLAPLEIVGI